MPQLGKQTQKSLKPTTHDTIYWDAGVRRPGVRIRPSHPRTYVLSYRPVASARKRRITLGLIDEIRH